MFSKQTSTNIHKPEVLVFKTNIHTSPEARALCTALSSVPGVQRCSVDLEDCDKVLRVCGECLQSKFLVKIVEDWGLNIVELED
ncbi:MAG: hypothetical protein GC192_18010 [Bacteroidetes bacterium]|nr:hypothetical protein [Bacteroidota bacterium]